MQTAEQARAMFDLLTQETYYGMNMRLEIMNMTDDEYRALHAFAQKCYTARQKKDNTI